MINNLNNKELIEELISISKEAGDAILKVYNSDFYYQIKDDLSPLTEADKLSNQIIYKRLKRLSPGIPILSEEDSNINYKVRSKWEKYWLVDPLDGTKEFIKKNGEFTVNIALIQNTKPILGVIYVPISNETYWGSKKEGSFYSDGQKTLKIKVRKKDNKCLTILSSRSHPSVELHDFIKKFKEPEIIQKGSSLKLCLLAAGKGDIYPRLSPTSEWDIAAGHSILLGSGGNIYDLKGQQITYNKKSSFLNSDFLAVTSKKLFTEIIMHLNFIKQ
jgi:3'(2'), 5'-bisphosphate nucleotidase